MTPFEICLNYTSHFFILDPYNKLLKFCLFVALTTLRHFGCQEFYHRKVNTWHMSFNKFFFTEMPSSPSFNNALIPWEKEKPWHKMRIISSKFQEHQKSYQSQICLLVFLLLDLHILPLYYNASFLVNSFIPAIQCIILVNSIIIKNST